MRLRPANYAAPDSWSRGILHPGPWRPARILGWGVGLLALVLGGTFLLGFALRHLAPANTGPVKLLHLLIVLILALCIYVAAVIYIERRQVSEFAPRHAIPELALGLACGFGVFSIVMLTLVTAGAYTLAGPHAGIPWPGITLSIGSGVAEELLFRGIIFRLLWGALGLNWALGLSAALFGLMHLLNPGHNIAGALSLIIEAGLFLAAFYVLTGRLHASIGTHIAWNFTQGYVFGATVSGTNFGPSLYVATPVPGASALLTGGAFGPEASVPAILAGSLAALALLAWTYRRDRLH
jgi:membrane protease YdiL (CAAX protease family)